MADTIDERVTQFSVDWMLSERETEALHDLIAEVRAERSACGHLLAELQGKDGGTRWCAGCEREAGIRAEVVEEAAQVADLQAKHNLVMSEDEAPDKAWCVDRALTAQVIRDAIRALAPADYVAIRRESVEQAFDAEDYERVVDIIRAALSRAGKGK